MTMDNKFNIGDKAYVVMRGIGANYPITEVTIIDITKHKESADRYYKTQIKDSIMLTVRKDDNIYKTLEEAEFGRIKEIKADIKEYTNYILEHKKNIFKLEKELKLSRFAIDNLRDKINTLKELINGQQSNN
jgi:hypothetical protein